MAARRQRPAPASEPVRVETERGTYVRPADLAEALRLLAEHPDALLVAGSTDVGVEVNLRGRRADLVIGIDRLPQLRTLEVTDDVVEIGAALTLSELERGLAGRIELIDELLGQFASRLIRNGATLGGNLGTASPIGDSPPALLALGARLVLCRADGEREVELADYFTGYRQTLRRDDELIRAVRLPRPTPRLTAFHKIAKRRFDDISSIAVAFGLDVTDGVVTGARIGLGGAAAVPLRARDTEQALLGRPWNAETIRTAAVVLGQEGTPMDDHRAGADYRRAMLAAALPKFFDTHPDPDQAGRGDAR